MTIFEITQRFPAFARLSPRQRAVMTELAFGFSTKETAKRLGIAAGTVKCHSAAIYRTLGASNRADAVRIGLTSAAWRKSESQNGSLIQRAMADTSGVTALEYGVIASAAVPVLLVTFNTFYVAVTNALMTFVAGL